VARPTSSPTETIQRDNLGAVLRQVHTHGSVSRSDVVARTGLSRSGVKIIAERLAALGLILERSPEPSGVPGRPSSVLHADPYGAVALAFEVSVDSIAAATIGLGGRVFQAIRVDRPRIRFRPEDTVADMASMADRLLGSDAAWDRVVGVGVAIAGIVRTADGMVHLAPNLAWHEVPLGELIATAIGRAAPVFVANEADLGARAEHLRGAGIGVDDLVYLHGEVGLGGGIIVDGRLLRGAAGYAGEVGHLTLDPGGRLCGCGSRGCWETEVGEAALLRAAGRGDAPLGRSSVDEVLAEAARGVPRALAAMDHIGTWLGVGIAGIVNVFDPRRVVLGGLFGRCAPYLMAAMTRELEARALPMSRALVDVVPGCLGDTVLLTGAAEAAFEPLLEDPARFAPAPSSKRIPEPLEVRP
jgi:predicted NBD/HSP70 family sugar kinase